MLIGGDSQLWRRFLHPFPSWAEILLFISQVRDGNFSQVPGAIMEVIEITFAPKEAFKQVSIVLALQAAILTTSFFVKGWEYISQSFTQVGRLRRSLLNAMSREVNSYTEWLRLARQLDSTSKGVNEWILEDRCELYDCNTLHKRILDIETMIAKSDAFNLIFRLRGGLARDQFGLLQERLFSKAFQGTKRLVERYTQTVCSALNFIADEDLFGNNNQINYSDVEKVGKEDKIPIEAKLAFFNETRHAYGRTALLLSGGAALGYYHIGVAKVLAEEGLLPRVISGASAGSLMAAMIGSRTESELIDLVKTADFRKDFFSFGWQRKSSLTARFQFLLPSFFRTFGDAFFHILSEKKSILKLDTNHLKEVIIANVGHYTFQEAFDRTGRIVNITVAPLNRYDRPRLLNYLTAPHVCIWSAACASCAIPGVFESIALVVKEPDGQYREEHEWTSQCATELSAPNSLPTPLPTESPSLHSSTKYSDGSIENDLPMQQLSELFNVNHFIVSQVNPHSFLLSSLSTHSIQGTPGPLRAAAGYLRFAKAQLREWLRNLIDLFMYRRTNSMFGITFRRGFAQILTQEYEGRENDISIMPWKLPAGISLIKAFLSLMKNPTENEFREIVKISERNTYPYIARIRAHCAVEICLDQCVQRLRHRIARSARHSAKHKVDSPDESPPVFTSRSMVNLSGLGVTDPLILSHLPPNSADEDKDESEQKSGVMNAFYYKTLDSKSK